MEGPRACRVDELPALRRLQNAVFRPRDGDMFGEYPHMYGEHNVDNLRITTDGGRVVSCVGMTQRWALLEGCAISCCLIGGVCTDADYRERGLATACLRDVLTKARADGVDLGLISGGRGMYLREGARRVGREWGATLDMAAAERVADSSLTVATWEPDREMAEVAAMYDREPVRWLRPLDDYRFFARSGFVIDWACTIGVVRRAGAAVAYMLVSTPDEEGGSCLFEYAGEPCASEAPEASASRSSTVTCPCGSAWRWLARRSPRRRPTTQR
jgi:GNAT superfamily N-acetyltransferase